MIRTSVSVNFKNTQSGLGTSKFDPFQSPLWLSRTYTKHNKQWEHGWNFRFWRFKLPNLFFFSILSYDTSQSSYWNLVAVFSQSYINVKSKTVVFSVFTSHVIKTKNRNRSMNKVKNLGYDRWMMYKQPRQESGLCCFSFARYLQKCVTQI